ncbi:MAG: hypothetical protein IJO56_07645 [Oscillospiraceae bacterium]|nr:hypothetical protein [Oscillospiraceae bacterium]
MRGHELLETIENLNPAYIEAAAKKPYRKTTWWTKWVAIAACLCLIITGVALWGNLGEYEKNPDAGAGVSGGDAGGAWPEGVDPVVASLAVIPAGVDLLDVADAVLVSISEEDAKAVEVLGGYLPTALPEGCHYGKASHYKTTMKDGTGYQMLRVTYAVGEASVSTPIPENGETEPAQMIEDTAFLLMVFGHRPDTDLPVYQSEEVSASLIEQQDGRVFYIDYNGIFVGVQQQEISAADLFFVIESIG